MRRSLLSAWANFHGFMYCILGHGGKSKFDVKVQREERLLRKSVIAYIGAAGDFTGSYIVRFEHTCRSLTMTYLQSRKLPLFCRR